MDTIKNLLVQGSNLKTQGKSEEAISVYNKIIKIDPNNSEAFFRLGEIYQSKKNFSQSIHFYNKTIKLNPFNQKALAKLGRLITWNSNLTETIASYSILDKALYKIYGDNKESLQNGILSIWNSPTSNLQSLDRTIANLLELGFIGKQGSTVNPLRYYIVNQQQKIIYCTIPKNACTLFKMILVENSNYAEEYHNCSSKQDVHSFWLTKNIYKLETLLNFLQSPDYFKFVVIRNPLTRIISGYINKFIREKTTPPYVEHIIRRVYQNNHWDLDKMRSINFEQLVQYLLNTEDIQINEHWRPQYTFMCSLNCFDLIGKFEDLDKSIDILERRMNIKIPRKVAYNSTKYKYSTNQQNFSKMYPSELRKLETMPTAEQFYTPELESAIRQRYSKDIEIYEQSFGTKIEKIF